MLTRQASTDPLTGAINRRKLMEIGRAELTRQPRQAQAIALLLCDIDHFKRINDTLGHKAGDQVLQDFYRRALGVTRASDSICRWGGEEFLILLPDTDAPGADHLAERLRQAISADLFKPGHTPPLQVTVTIGVATVQADEGLLDAVHRADEALYRGKQQGRNQVVSSLPPAARPAAAEPPLRWQK